MRTQTAPHGKQTSLALENFPGHGRRFQDVPAFVRAYARVKAACARANVELGALDAPRGQAIERAALSVAALEHMDAFPVPLIQGGGGTSSNMNVNEVIAELASELLAAAPLASGRLEVHPNDHVNASQSTNDTYPTAMSLALIEISSGAVTALMGLEEALLAQALRGQGARRLGRTCLRDAVSLTIEETHRAQAALVASSREHLELSLSGLCEVPLGGTVLGTGIGAPEGFAQSAVGWLSSIADCQLRPAKNPFATLAHLGAYAAIADACKRVAVVLARIATDLRWLSSGPVGGPGEVFLPELQAGSSIMPGKVNPVIPELVMQLSYRIRGAAHAADLAVAAGELELNVMEPLVFDALLTCLDDIEAASSVFADKCVSGLTWHRPAVTQALSGALDEYVDLARSIGYSPAADAAKQRSRSRTAAIDGDDGDHHPARFDMRSIQDGH
jgi:aspartate ammonia-lyase